MVAGLRSRGFHLSQIAQQQAAKEQVEKGLSAIEIARGISEVEITPTPDDLYHKAQEAATQGSDDGLTLDDRLRKELPLVAFPGVDLSAGHGFKTHELAGKGSAFVPREQAHLTGYVKGATVRTSCLHGKMLGLWIHYLLRRNVARRNRYGILKPPSPLASSRRSCPHTWPNETWITWHRSLTFPALDTWAALNLDRRPSTGLLWVLTHGRLESRR